MIKTMTNGKYLRLCKRHGVEPVYLDEKAKAKQQKQIRSNKFSETFGDGFVLVTPSVLPGPKKTRAAVPEAKTFTESKSKKPKRSRAKRRWREHLQRFARAEERMSEHDRLAQGRWATAAPMSNYTRTLRTVSGGLPSLGKRR